jgi:prolyl-tRNA synthetase
MTELFIPKTKNPPAKVKDAGVVNLVMEGAGAYNAKSGEIILLPAGCERLARLSDLLKTSLFNMCGMQPVDCPGSDDSVYTLAERYVRDFKDKALSWMQSRGRSLLLYGWAKSEEESVVKAEGAASAIKEALLELLPGFSFTKISSRDRFVSLVGVCETARGSLNAVNGMKCLKCGTLVLPDSVCTAVGEPVNACAHEEEIRDIYTPGAHTISLLCQQLGLEPKNTLKAMLYTVESNDGTKDLLFAMIRGDMDISISKLSAYVGSKFQGASFRRAEAEEILDAFGDVAGFCGPIGVPGNVHMVADMSLKDGRNFVVGANRPDYHKTGCCWGRDFEPDVADLLLYQKSVPCPDCGGDLDECELRRICAIEAYEAARNGEPILSCRDRDGVSAWPYRWRGEISLEALLCAVYEKGVKDGL